MVEANKYLTADIISVLVVGGYMGYNVYVTWVTERKQFKKFENSDQD